MIFIIVMNPNELIYSILIYIFAVLVHEFGHFIVSKYYNKFIGFQFDSIIPHVIYNTEEILSEEGSFSKGERVQIFESLSKGERLSDDTNKEINILISGIILGLIILIIYGIYLNDKYQISGILLLIVLIISYFIGSLHDIKRLTQIV